MRIRHTHQYSIEKVWYYRTESLKNDITTSVLKAGCALLIPVVHTGQ